MSTISLVSVIMNCHNSETHLREAIQSVFSQTYTNWEIIFFDNASTDNSKEIADSFGKKIKYFYSKKLLKLGAARNAAMKQASGKYICFLDCDDLYEPIFLEKIVEELESGHHALCYCGANIIDDAGNILRLWNVKNISGQNFGNLLNHYEIKMVCTVIRRSILIENNLQFLESLTYNPDFNLFMTIASRYPIGVVPMRLAKYRKSTNSLSTKSLGVIAPEIRYTLDLLYNEESGNRDIYKKQFQSAYNKTKIYEAAGYLKNRCRLDAIKNVASVALTRPIYMAILIILMLPLSNDFILRLLRK